MKKQHSKLLKLNKKVISNFSIYGGAPPPRDTEHSTCSLPMEEEESEHPNTTSTYALTFKLSCY